MHSETDRWVGSYEEDRIVFYVISVKLKMKLILFCAACIITFKISVISQSRSRRGERVQMMVINTLFGDDTERNRRHCMADPLPKCAVFYYFYPIFHSHAFAVNLFVLCMRFPLWNSSYWDKFKMKIISVFNND